MPMWEGEEDLSNGDKGATPKQRYELDYIFSRCNEVDFVFKTDKICTIVWTFKDQLIQLNLYLKF